MNPSALSRLPRPGDVVAGKYRIEGPLGQGGMGAVFAAQHLLLNQRVVLKLALPDLARDPEFVARFLNEARAAARLESDHAVGVMDTGTIEDGTPYIVMEYLDGQDLARILRARGPIPVALAVDWVMQALEAIAEAHARGIVHRNLKPSNLFLAKRSDGTLRVKVLDFGISKVVSTGGGATAPELTSSRSSLGSPSYMSPEQLRSTKDVDGRTDVWAIGIVLYELLTGRVPFQADSPTALVATILEQHPPALSSVRPDVPFALEAAVHRCVAKERSARFGDVAELARALAPFGPPGSHPLLERITHVLAAAGAEASAKPPSAGFAIAPTERAPAATPGSARTTSAWTGLEPHAAGSTRTAIWLSIAGVLLLGGTIAAILVATSKPAPTSDATRSVTTPMPAAPPPSTVTTTAPPEPSTARTSVPIDSLPTAQPPASSSSPANSTLPTRPTLHPRPTAIATATATAAATQTSTATATSTTPGIAPVLKSRD